jgi:hypothetical protein
MHRLFPVVAAVVWLASAFAPLSALAGEVRLPEHKEFEDALPEGGSLSGRTIFDRFLDNRLHSAVEWQTVVTRDPGGSEQKMRFWVRWKDYRDAKKHAVDGVIAKTLLKFQEPEDLRQTGYLLIMNENRSNDEFIWSPATGRVRRVRLRGVGVMGTDYTLDDIGWKNIEDAEYERLTDENLDGIPVYVLEVTMKPFVDSDYKTMRTWIEKEHYVPLRTLYRDKNGVDMRELRAEATSIEDFDGAWIPTRSVMTNLKEKTSTSIFVEGLDPNVKLADQHFSALQLTMHH